MGSACIITVNPVIPVKNMRESLAYYERKLGFKKLFDDVGKGKEAITYAGVGRGTVCLHLQAMVAGQDDAMPLIRIAVENIEALYEEYSKQGVVAQTAHLEEKPWGSKDFGLYDPNGAAIVFYQDT